MSDVVNPQEDGNPAIKVDVHAARGMGFTL